MDERAIIAIVLLVVVVFFIIIIICWPSLETKEEKEVETKQIEEKEVLVEEVEVETTIEKKEISDEDIENLKKYKELLEDNIITQEEYEQAKNQILRIEKKPKMGVKCPNCGHSDCQIINEFSTTGTDYDASEGCCGYILLGPIGLLCGACGEGKETKNTNYWVCKNCGKKWKV